MIELKEALIGRHNIKNVWFSLKKDSSQISYNDIKPGMVVEVTDKKRGTTTRYISVSYKDCVLDVVDLESFNRTDLVLLTPRDTDTGFSFWSLKDFKRMFPSHYMWPNAVYISNVWMTDIDTKRLDVDELRKEFKRTVNQLD